VPAAAFYYGGVLLRRRKTDIPAAILDLGAAEDLAAPEVGVDHLALALELAL
jgi:hypothetical protein